MRRVIFECATEKRASTDFIEYTADDEGINGESLTTYAFQSIIPDTVDSAIFDAVCADK
jgi:hypothetical protein